MITARPTRPLLMALALLALFCSGTPASAALLTVTSVADDGGSGTLRSVLAAAQSGDTVAFDPTVFSASAPQTITLVGGELGINRDLVIQGPGANVLTLSGGHVSRVFNVSSGTVSFSGLTVSNGVVIGYYGGGIYNGTGNLTFINCNVSNNRATDGNGAIGVCAGLYNSQGTVTLTNCNVTDNSADGDCGGIENGGTMTLTGCTLSGNVAEGGAGIENNGALTLTGCELDHNTATNGVGGAIASGGTLTMTQCSLESNSASSGAGGVCNNGFGHQVATLSQCSLVGNLSGGDGGGIQQDGYYVTMILTNCSLIGNSAAMDGGGIKNGGNDGGRLTLTNCTLTANSAGRDGGGIKTYLFGSNDFGASLTLTNSLLYGDRAVTGGNEIYLDPGSAFPAVTHCDIADPSYVGTGGNVNAAPLFTSPATGDVHLKPGSPCLGAGVTVTGVTTDKDGTARPNPPSIGAYELGSTLTVPGQYATIQAAINAANPGNTVLISDGTYTGPGNVDLDFGGRNITVTTVNGPASTIIDCQGTSSANHRGFHLHSGETNAVISGLTIENGYETPAFDGEDSSDGGGIFIEGSSVTVADCTFTGNTVTGRGGGVANFTFSNNGTTTLTNCTFTANTAGEGGGIYNLNDGGDITSVTNCTLTGNSSPNEYGGGIFNANFDGTISVTNCTLNGNSAGTGGGIANSNSGNTGSISVTNCTLNGNSATSSGDGLFNDTAYGSISLTNDIVYGDTGAGGEIANRDNPSTVSYCDIGDPSYAGTSGNIAADPLFVSATDLHLQVGSPCLGAGTASGAPATTIDGYTRPNPPSIGAYELKPTVPTTVTVANVSGAAGQTVTLSAVLKTTGGAALSGQALTFSVDGIAVGTGITNASGAATLAYAIPAALTVGSHTLTAAFSGDSTNAASSGTATLTVTKANTAVTVGARSGKAGTTVVLKSYLKTSGGVVLAGRTLTYAVNGTAAGSAATDSTGLASLSYVIPASAPSGNEPVAVSFAGDGGDNSGSGVGTLTVTGTGTAPATSLAVGNVSGTQGQAVSLSATLTLTGGAGLSGKTLTFSVDGTTVGTAVTNAGGVATKTYAIPVASSVGSHTIGASFAGDGSGAASSGSGTLTVTAGKVATVVTVGARAAKAGTTTVLKSYLKTAGGAVLPGRTLSYVVNGVSAGSAVTDSTGLASLTYTIPASSPAGNEPIVVSFGGDGGDNPSSGKGTLTVS